MSQTQNLPSTLPREYYISDDIFREEVETIFYRHWICVGRKSQVAKPGDYFTAQIGDESILITRDQRDQVRAFYNVCRHRGVQLCSQSCGTLSKSIQCPYHAWTYSLDGTLVGAPHMNEVPGFDKSNYSLRTVALEEWEGFLFVNLDENPQPIREVYAAFFDQYRDWNLPNLETVRTVEYDIAANWKLLSENYQECYHCALVHPELNALSDYQNTDDFMTEGTILGGYMTMNESKGSLTFSGQRCGPLLGQIQGQEVHRVYFNSIFPNLFLSVHPDYVMYHIVWPQEPGRTLITCGWMFEKVTDKTTETNPSDATEFWDMTNRQDWEICERAQLGMKSRSYVPGPACGDQEKLVLSFDREVLKALGR